MEMFKINLIISIRIHLVHNTNLHSIFIHYQSFENGIEPQSIKNFIALYILYS